MAHDATISTQNANPSVDSGAAPPASSTAMTRLRGLLAPRRLLFAAVVAVIVGAPLAGFASISAPQTTMLAAVIIGLWITRDRVPLLSGACAAIAAAVSLPAAVLVAWLVLRPGAPRRSILAGAAGTAGAFIVAALALNAADVGVLSAALVDGSANPGSLPALIQSSRASGIVAQVAIVSLGLCMLVLALALRHNDRMSYGMFALAGAVASPLVPVPALVMTIGALALWDREPAPAAPEEGPLLDPQPWSQGVPVGSRRPMEQMWAEAAAAGAATRSSLRGPVRAQIRVDTQLRSAMVSRPPSAATRRP